MLSVKYKKLCYHLGSRKSESFCFLFDRFCFSLSYTVPNLDTIIVIGRVRKTIPNVRSTAPITLPPEISPLLSIAISGMTDHSLGTADIHKVSGQSFLRANQFYALISVLRVSNFYGPIIFTGQSVYALISVLRANNFYGPVLFTGQSFLQAKIFTGQ